MNKTSINAAMHCRSLMPPTLFGHWVGLSMGRALDTELLAAWLATDQPRYGYPPRFCLRHWHITDALALPLVALAQALEAVLPLEEHLAALAANKHTLPRLRQLQRGAPALQDHPALQHLGGWQRGLLCWRIANALGKRLNAEPLRPPPPPLFCDHGLALMEDLLRLWPSATPPLLVFEVTCHPSAIAVALLRLAEMAERCSHCYLVLVLPSNLQRYLASDGDNLLKATLRRYPFFPLDSL